MAKQRTKASYNKRLEALKSERSSHIDYWRELSDNCLAHRGRFLTADRNKGTKRNTKQLNNTARLSVRTLASGMMAGITSPARPWFRLATSNPAMLENGDVKLWLEEVESLMREVFNQSNLYNSLHTMYSELGTFGTGVMGVFFDYENVIHCKVYTIGSYLLGLNGKNEVDTMYREYEMTVDQLVKEFGYENCSQAVQHSWDNGRGEAWIPIVHAIEPNDDRDNTNPMAKHKAWRSVYYEKANAKASATDYLRESGFDEFAIMAPRWDVTGEDVYGSDCPGMIALGDIKVLQLGERRSYQAVDTLVKPPLQAPSSLEHKLSDVVAGDILFVNDTSQGGIKSLYDFRPDLSAIEVKIEKSEERVKRAFYEDLFLMLANSDRRQITAREVAEKHEEKLLMLGPVLERLHSELLDPLIDRTFNIMAKAGMLPEPPEELLEQELRVEYISVLAQAQRMVAVTGVERLTEFTGNLAAVWPDVRHKIDAAQAVDDYANSIGVSPRIVRSDDDVAEIVAQEQQALAQQQQMEQAAASTDMAQKASQIDGENLSNMADQVAGLNATP